MTGFRLRPGMLGLAVLVVAVVGGVLFGTPWGRDQVRLSTTRIDAPFWELYLQDPEPRCPAAGSTTSVVVVTANRADDPQPISWRAEVVSADGRVTALGARNDTAAPGEVRRTTITVPGARGRFTLVVHDQGDVHRLQVLCGGTT